MIDQIHRRLTTDFKYFAEKAPLMIVDKDGKRKPLIFNQAQLIAHEATERMKAEVGFVRLLFLKGRQQGISTYVGGRFYWGTSKSFGHNTFVMAHDTDTTDKLFKMTKRYHEHIHPALKPSTQRSNKKELLFDKLDSQYYVGTAGTGTTGRGGTVQRFHGSEVAFWSDPDSIRSGIMQSIPLSRGTEVFLESTANGYDPMFRPMVVDARQKKGDYRLCFIPWFIQSEYRRSAEGLVPTDEENELIKTYNLDLEQISFRRNKIIELKSDKLFMQEYPFNVDEAFQVSGNSLFSGHAIQNAKERTIKDFDSPIILGADIATEKDRMSLVVRRGREILHIFSHDCSKQSLEATEIAGMIINCASVHNVDHCFIDLGEVGKGVYDILKSMNLGFDITGVRFQFTAKEDDTYANIRAEMYYDAKEWVKDASLPDNDELINDLMVIPEGKPDSRGRILLPPKEKIKKEFGFSPDVGDAFVLTFAYPVKNRRMQGHNKLTVKFKGFTPKGY